MEGTGAVRIAIVKGDVNVIRKYMPSNYDAEQLFDTEWVMIHGFDVAGWTMEDYVVPRLGSGNYYVRVIE